VEGEVVGGGRSHIFSWDSA